MVFTARPGGPDDPPAVFVELEDDTGRSIDFGEWVDRGEYVALRIPMGESAFSGSAATKVYGGGLRDVREVRSLAGEAAQRWIIHTLGSQ